MSRKLTTALAALSLTFAWACAVAPETESEEVSEAEAFLSGSGGNSCGGSGKVDICHIPPGNPENQHTITVSVNAIRAHLAHGDYLGECSPTRGDTDPTPN